MDERSLARPLDLSTERTKKRTEGGTDGRSSQGVPPYVPGIASESWVDFPPGIRLIENADFDSFATTSTDSVTNNSQSVGVHSAYNRFGTSQRTILSLAYQRISRRNRREALDHFEPRRHPRTTSTLPLIVRSVPRSVVLYSSSSSSRTEDFFSTNTFNSREEEASKQTSRPVG